MNKIFSTLFLLLAGVVLSHAQDTTQHAVKKPLVTTRVRDLLHGKGQVETQTDTLRKPVDSLQTKLIQRKDSLAAASIPATGGVLPGKVTAVQGQAEHAGDSIQQRISAATHKPEEVLQTAEHKVDSLQQRLTTPVESLQHKAEEKLQSVTGGKASLPEAVGNVPGVEGPSLPGLDTSMPGVTTEVASIPGLELPTTDLKPDLAGITPEMPGELKELNSLTEETKELDGALGQAEQYEKGLREVSEASPETIEAQAEQHLTEVKQVSAVNSEITKATAEQAKYEALIQRYRDEKLIQEEIKRKAKSVANAQILEHADKVQAAQGELAKAKRGATGLKRVKTLFQKHSTELESKKFYQRLVPGITWQIYKREYVSADLALQTGYRVTPSLTAGVGVLYRVGFSEDFDLFVHGLKTYGGRIYVDFTVAKGLFVHGEFEALKVNPALAATAPEPISDRVYGSYFGLGKRFNITRNLRGQIQGLYRVEYTGELPDVNKVSARFGVEYVFRRARKKLPGL